MMNMGRVGHFFLLFPPVYRATFQVVRVSALIIVIVNHNKALPVSVTLRFMPLCFSGQHRHVCPSLELSPLVEHRRVLSEVN
jgi:hypothetical protein